MLNSLIKGMVDCGEYDLEHFWLQLPNGTIIDPTADQLPRRKGKRPPKVYIGEIPPWYSEAPDPADSEMYDER